MGATCSHDLLPTAADYCDDILQHGVQDDIHLQVWAPDARQHCLRLYAPVKVSHHLDGISVSASEKNINPGPFHQLLIEDAEIGHGPDLALVYQGTSLQSMADLGYLYPLDQCNLSADDWTSAIFQQRQWGLPFELDVFVLFYSKSVLRALGWDNTRIDQLPDNIASGAFTLSDLLTVAREALDNRLVKPGFAVTLHEDNFPSTMQVFQSYGGRLSSNRKHRKLNERALELTYGLFQQLSAANLMHYAITQPGYSNISNRFTMRDALASGRILFAHTVASERTRILLDHVETEAILNDNLGMALLPTDQRQPGAMMGFMGSYVILSEQATGKTHQQAACEVLMALTDSDYRQQHALSTSQVAPLHDGLWVPPALPDLSLSQLRHTHASHQEFQSFKDQVNDMTARLTRDSIAVHQAAALTARQLTSLK